MAIGTWGAVYTPKQKVAFIKVLLPALETLISEVGQRELVKISLGWGQSGDFKGKWGYQSLYITGEGLYVHTRWDRFFRKSIIEDVLVESDNIPLFLESHRVGLDDIKALLGKFKVMDALHALMCLPDANALAPDHPLEIRKGYLEGTSVVGTIKLTPEGVECLSRRDDRARIYSIAEITFDWVNAWDLKLEEVESARARLLALPS